MPNPEHIYSFNYDYHHEELCNLESRQIFGAEQKDKFLFSDIEIDPSISPFIKSRLDIICSSESYSEILRMVEAENIHAEGFKAEYLVLKGDSTGYRARLNKLRDIGYRVEGEPDYYEPTIVYSLCHYEKIWHFGVLAKQDNSWQKHKQKPHSFSNSIGMEIAKSLVCIASGGRKANKLLDVCCGVGTIMLEGCFSGFQIDGCDISLNATQHTLQNLAHYNYKAKVFHSDVKQLNNSYDGAIIDLPYNLYSYSNDSIVANIIESTVNLTNRIVIVSISDISALIENSGLEIMDFCTVEKRGKSLFARNIWVCERR